MSAAKIMSVNPRAQQRQVAARNTLIFPEYKVWSVRGIFRGLIGGDYSGYEGFVQKHNVPILWINYQAKKWQVMTAGPSH